MPLSVGVGSSINLSPDIAIKEALAQVGIGINNKSPQLVILYASANVYDNHQLLKEIRKRHPQTAIIGCTTSAQITSSGIFDAGITITAFHSTEHTFTPFVQTDHSTNSYTIAEKIAQQLTNNATPPSLVLLFSAGLVGNQQQLLDGFKNNLPPHTPIFGAVAADNLQYQQTQQFFNTNVYTHGVVGVAIAGPLKLTAGNTHGWTPIGSTHDITHSTHAQISQISNQPAISIYQQLFEPARLQTALQQGLPKFSSDYPLGMYDPSIQDYLIRIPIHVTNQGEFICDANFTQNQPISIMISSPEECFTAYKHMLTQIAEQYLSTKRPLLSLMFNASARKKLLTNKKEQEIENYIHLFSANTPLAGIYTYGEFFTPLDGSTDPFYQNQSVTMLMIS